ncbi:hypothetical protein [Chryseobacterium sp. FH1]|uniref:hypothetical protein n=1 Tax=Chryseobacterium sp. FH1 TaxID=1233951 RepID=UPI0004E3AA03|nr:hypothetical protein [Chryseobacterium sp. FH1]KFC24535.1 hypothetical protein IO90_04405 [Chryseobacterium sp. FH1]
MAILTYENYTSAVRSWAEVKSNYSDIQNVISPEKVFILSREQIEWFDRENEAETYFRADIGVWENNLVMILTPRTSAGDVKTMDNYEFCPLQFLENDLTLKQTKTYTVASTYVLSKDLSKSEQDSDFNFPVMNEPVTGQMKAVEEIESWKENAMDYLHRESLEFKGQRIFQSFYIPKADLLHNKENTHDIVAVFGFKYSAVYQRLLATLIFISNENGVKLGAPGAVYEVKPDPSNIYDWSRPCPPTCLTP